jgi:acyl-CoA synthetase (AMP-forming)/AMP-acid ligase II
MAHNRDISVLADVPRLHARVRPLDIAMIFEERTTSYQALDTFSSQVANGIISSGAKRQSRIGYLGKNTDHFFEILYGCAKSNTAIVAVNWRLAPPEVEFILNDSEVHILFVSSAYLGLIESIKDRLTTVHHVVVIGGARGNWEDYVSWRDRQASKDPAAPVDREDVAVQMYTSGTTGRPKGAMLTHRNLLAVFETIEPGAAGRWNEWYADDINLITTPVFHIAGTGWGHYGLYNGIKNVILSEFSIDSVLDAIERFRVTKVGMVPAALKMLLQSPRATSTDYSSIRCLSYGASPIPPDLLREAMDIIKCDYVQLYGMTEMAGTVSYLPSEDHDLAGNPRMLSAGIPLPGIEICIMDANSNRMPAGEMGEICVKGPGMMKGYWKQPEATERTIQEDGWLRSGDVGYIDKDGYVYVHDRVKDMIVSGAENVYPAEVESALFCHPAVADVAVIGVPSDRWGEEVKAVVVLKAGTSTTAEDLIDFARKRIAAYKAPRSVDFVAELPRNPSGKVLKVELRAPYWKGKQRMVN